MTQMTFYTHPQSRGRIARWMLEEVGADYEVRVMDFDGNIKSPEFLQLNPMGKVPALVHGDTVITELAAICAYLADQFPGKGLAPAVDSPLRGCYYRWLFFVAGPVEIAMSAKTYNWRIDDDNASSVGCGKTGDTADTLERAVAGESYLCGDRFTAADLLLASYLAFEMQVTKTLEPRPAFVNYVERCQAREAATRANALDDALPQAAAG
ncbi:glutathione S-transferase family protein [Parahaliea mediterranea]|uniref:Glutathione S-transferase family protein n=1 Tax=Parahaliea mediterranea TaxID=651086 RepID=A0A939DBQ5_9GAMM|nr:glutathione S-transferase family protein [Parahaliea mediterranea]MBN7795308.1 glutathione S-transferase family protein [Parahaliea mediterranea]